MQHIDDLALMCGQIFSEALANTGKQATSARVLLDALTRPLVKGDLTFGLIAIGLLERALESSPANFQMKLLLLRMWCALGTYTAVNRARPQQC